MGLRTFLANIRAGGRVKPTGDTAEFGRATAHFMIDYLKRNGYSPDDLVTKKGFDIYDKMQTDGQVKAATETKKLAVLSKPWYIKPASKSAEDRKVAEFVTWALTKAHIDDALYDLLDAIPKGFGLCEKVWYLVNDDRDWEGYYALRAVKPKNPKDFSFDVDEYMNVKNLLLYLPGDVGQTMLPTEKFVLYTYRPAYGMPWGQSDLRAAYRHWWCKDFLIKWWQLFTEKYAMPTIVGYYKSGTSSTKQREFLSVLEKIMSDTAIIIPEEISDAVKEIFTSRDPRIMYESAVGYHDTQIAKAILFETLTQDSPGRGGSASFAMAKIHQDTLVYQLSKMKATLESQVVEDQVIRELVRVNFGSQVAIPSFHFKPMQQSDIDAISNAFWKLAQVGIVAPEEAWIREEMGFPEREKGAESLPEMQAKAKSEIARPRVEPVGSPEEDEAGVKPGDDQQAQDEGKKPLGGKDGEGKPAK